MYEKEVLEQGEEEPGALLGKIVDKVLRSGEDDVPRAL